MHDKVDDQDKTKFEEDLTALTPYLRAFGRTLSGSRERGDDLAQETILRALLNRGSFTMGTNLKSWTFTILRNVFYTEERRTWRSCSLDPGVAERTLIAADDVTRMLELDELRRALAMLPQDQREALILVGAAGLSYDEAAEIAGVAVGTIKSRVSRARSRLQFLVTEGSIETDDGPPRNAFAAILSQVNILTQGAAAA